MFTQQDQFSRFFSRGSIGFAVYANFNEKGTVDYRYSPDVEEGDLLAQFDVPADQFHRIYQPATHRK